jgi:hypothetical protein
MFGMMTRPTEVQIAQVNREGQRGLEDADRIVPVNREVTQSQKRADRAAFPKAERDHAFFCPFRGDPLNEEAKTENEGAGEADNFPRIDRDVEKFGGREEFEGAHGEDYPQRSEVHGDFSK